MGAARRWRPSGETYDVRNFGAKRGLHSRAQLCELGLEGLGDIDAVRARVNKGDNVKQRTLRGEEGTGRKRWAQSRKTLLATGQSVSRICLRDDAFCSLARETVARLLPCCLAFGLDHTCCAPPSPP